MIWIDCCPGFLFIAMINTNTKRNLGRKEFSVYRPSLRDRAGAQGGNLEAGSEAEASEAAAGWFVLLLTMLLYHEGPPWGGTAHSKMCPPSHIKKTPHRSHAGRFDGGIFSVAVELMGVCTFLCLSAPVYVCSWLCRQEAGLGCLLQSLFA